MIQKTIPISETSKTLNGNIQIINNEIEIFTKRNSIALIKQKNKTLHKCCNRCLKAHLLKKAKESNNKSLINHIIQLYKFEIGHNGYYLDEDKLLRI